MRTSRRNLVHWAAAQALGTGASRAPAATEARAPGGPVAAAYDTVRNGTHLHFPRDHGAHLGYRTEWWYLTAWLDRARSPLGLQITFFRSRTRHPPENPSRFAPRQLLFAHVALADPATGRLLHAQRAARAGIGPDQVLENDLSVAIGQWRFVRLPDDRYQARIEAEPFRLELDIDAGAALWLQGDQGYSRKGPRPEQASHYYSRPQLRGEARLRTRGARGFEPERHLACLGWLDHEWSSELLDERASGWDWLGLNLDDGAALMAFRIRPLAAAPRETAALWQDASLRRPDGVIERLGDGIRFEPLRWWRSPRTGVEYPVDMRLQLGSRSLRLKPLLDDQELDSRATTGAIYWEGAVRVLEGEREIGVGYLELTGYGERLRL